MGDTTQDGRQLSISTPLGKDFLLLNKLSASEGLSQMFSMELELLHDEGDDEGFETTIVTPEDILGQTVTMSIVQSDGLRYFTGIVNRFSQGNRNRRFSYYYATVVPHVWILTQNIQSRIFQHQSVPDILKKVLEGFEVKYEIQGEFKPRNYCVQYQESDFDFASRLMEEEGIYYYFEHDGNTDRMILANTPQSHRDCPNKSEIPYIVEKLTDDVWQSAIKSWRTESILQSGKVTAWDYNFQLPTKKLDQEQPSQFTIADNQKMEIYNYPGGSARKYDGIDKGGGEQPASLNNVYTDKQNNVKIQMQALDAQVKITTGYTDCCTLTAGHRFKLKNHPTASVDGQYVLTTVQHESEQSPDYISREPSAIPYEATFSCIPHGAGVPPFRPLRTTPKPLVHGTQTAMVVGPSGEEIFTDKYGRVKVQFHWDRDGQDNSDSSCWIRVAQSWAGNKWGMMFIPRIGMEVMVHFLEGDPDQPIITGCVYNPETMPPYKLPDEKTKMTIKSNSSTGGGGFNEFRFEDKKGSEQIFVHAEKDQDIRVKNDRREFIGKNRHLIVNNNKSERIKNNKNIIVDTTFKEKIGSDVHLTIGGKMAEKIGGSYSLKVGGAVAEEYGANFSGKATGSYSIQGSTIVLEAQTSLCIKAGGSFITLSAAGIQIKGTMVLINSGGAEVPAMMGNVVPPDAPDEAEIADNADPGSKSPTYRNQRRQLSKFKQRELAAPVHKPESVKNKEKVSWVEIKLIDDEGKPMAGEPYQVVLPDGSTVASGTLDENGYAKVNNIDPGSCKITFPKRDGRSWKKS